MLVLIVKGGLKGMLLVIIPTPNLGFRAFWGLCRVFRATEAAQLSGLGLRRALVVFSVDNEGSYP